MTEAIIVALITGGLSLLGVLITSSKTARDVAAKLDKQQAITDTKLETLCTKADKVEWKKVWAHYETMGFEIITIDTKLYAFHWGDAVEE